MVENWKEQNVDTKLQEDDYINHMEDILCDCDAARTHQVRRVQDDRAGDGYRCRSDAGARDGSKLRRCRKSRRLNKSMSHGSEGYDSVRRVEDAITAR